ncbi:hypothetical protein ACJX0J_039883, partial [Zea mays]
MGSKQTIKMTIVKHKSISYVVAVVASSVPTDIYKATAAALYIEYMISLVYNQTSHLFKYIPEPSKRYGLSYEVREINYTLHMLLFHHLPTTTLVFLVYVNILITTSKAVNFKKNRAYRYPTSRIPAISTPAISVRDSMIFARDRLILITSPGANQSAHNQISLNISFAQHGTNFLFLYITGDRSRDDDVTDLAGDGGDLD